MPPIPLPDYPGLSSAAVAERAARGEINTFKIQVGRTYWQIVRDNVFNLFNLVLATLGVFMIVFQDFSNLAFASFSVVLNSVVGLVQEISAKRALDQLAAMSIQQVRVWRDGKLMSVPVNQIAKDDVIPVEPGDRIAVDGRLVHTDSLEMDESLLTGESDAILKDDGDSLFSGSFVIAGSGTMLVTQVGAASTINKLSATAKAYRHPLTPTQKEINRLVQIAVVVMLLFGPMTVIAGFASRLETIEIVRNAVVLVTSMVPQGLVLVTTISLTIGALQISRNRTLVQRVNAVESMANVNVLCFDKTGTLTRNQLSVVRIIPLNDESEEAIKKRLYTYVNNLAHQNRTAAAVAEYAGNHGPVEATKLEEIPFTSARKWGAVVFSGETLMLGAPERVLDPSHSQTALTEASALAAQGQRVLAFSRSIQRPQADQLSTAREPLALIVMSDQVRPEISETIHAFYSLGVELKVISGDNLETVRSIAQQAGMREGNAYTGEQLEAMSGAELDQAVRTANIFARIEPETKRKIIRILKQQGNYVAMVGDGVNDVPALKEANMAVAMNDGAQIAKDVADIVLLDNSMATLPLAFEKGKTITQKIFGTTKLFLVKNFYSVLAFIFIGFMALPFSTTPILISWLTFGMVNVPGGLVTFGFLRPAHMRNFEHDVIRYVLAGIVVGGVTMAVLYAGMYLYRFNAEYQQIIESKAPDTAARLARGEIAADPVVAEHDRATIALANREAITPARDTARNALFVFMTLFGLVIFWNMVGIDLFDPKTFKEHARSVALGGALVATTLLPPCFLPDVFMNFKLPPLELWLVILVAFSLAVTVQHYFLRNGRLSTMVERPA